MSIFHITAIFILISVSPIHGLSFVNNYDGYLHFQCPTGSYISTIESIHSSHHEDRRFKFGCTHGFVGGSCHWTAGYVNNWDSRMDWSCPGNGVVTGAESFHDNHREDRRWKFRCCQLKDGVNVHLGGCEHTNWINHHDQKSNWKIPEGNVIIGFFSQHDNHREDRIWKVRKCAVCPRYWRGFHGKCYLFYNLFTSTWDQARSHCMQRHNQADLVSIHNDAENSLVISLSGGKQIWNGAMRTCSSCKNSFKWSDGTSWDFSKWNGGEPNNWRNQEDHVEVVPWNSKKWNDLSGTRKLGYVCQLYGSKCSKCGIKKAGTRVVGGSNASVNEYPWIAYLKWEWKAGFWGLGGTKTSTCGGTLISSRWVLTAYHCIENKKLGDLEIRLGEHQTNDGWDTLKMRKFHADHYYHPLPYGSPNKYSRDIALLRLKEEVDINIYTPICLPAPYQDFTGRKATAAGWGHTSTGGANALTLQELDGLTVTSDYDCKRDGFAISPDILCTRGQKGKGICNGDSGGPLIVLEGNSYTLIGVTSWRSTDGCGAGKSDGYAEVSQFVPWIEHVMLTYQDRGATCAA